MYIASRLDALFNVGKGHKCILYENVSYSIFLKIWNKTKFSCLKLTEETKDMLLFLVYLCKLSA